MKKILLTGAIVASIFSGCATITQDNTQGVTFASVPSGAKIYIDGQVKGVTPVTIQLDKGDAEKVKFEKEGYSSVEKELETSVDGWFFGNIIFGGLLGSSTDAVTGNMYEYTPNTYTIELKKK